MQRTGERRFRKRLPCQLMTSSHAHMGMVLNVSRGGLFVQTSVSTRPGDRIRLQLNPGAPEQMEIGAEVRWKRVVAPQLRAISPGGVGLCIRNAPEAYYAFLSVLASASS